MNKYSIAFLLVALPAAALAQPAASASGTSPANRDEAKINGLNSTETVPMARSEPKVTAPPHKNRPKKDSHGKAASAPAN